LGIAILLIAWEPGAYSLNPALDVSQYAHTAWTVRDGFSKGNIYAMAQTPDGYLWLGTEFGLFRFDGVRSVAWQPPPGQHLPDKGIFNLVAARDGTLWIGTFAGLVSWSGGKLIRPTELGDQFVTSLFEDRDGTVWAGTLGSPGRLCAFRSGNTQCFSGDGMFGRAVWALYEDSSGNIWAGAESGLWRVKPGPPRRYPAPTEVIGVSNTDDGQLLTAMHGSGLLRLAGDTLESYPIRAATSSNRPLRERDVNSNKLLRDRDGGLWIGTIERGLIHVHHGRTDVFTRSDGLSGDVVLSLFEDREGNVWVTTTGGLDRFRELPVTTVSTKQGLSSDATQSVLAATDGSIWVGTHDGLTKWKKGQTTIFRKSSGLPDDDLQSLFQDDRGRIWAFTGHELAYFNDGRFVPVTAVRGQDAHSITGDSAGNLWVSENQRLLHLLDGRLVEQIPWSTLGRVGGGASVVRSGSEQGGVWLGFWAGGGVSYFKDGRLRASYTTADGLGEGVVTDLQLERDGALWAATQGGLSHVKDGRIATLTSRNGLPCDTIIWTKEDDDRSFWLYTACGLVRIARPELDAWIADPKRRVETTVWDAADGVRLRSTAASSYSPRVAKSTDGKLWFLTGEGVQVVDPHHFAVNEIPPPVRIEQVIADQKLYWQNSTSNAVISNLRLPPRIRDLQIDYTALSLVAPEKVHFKYKLEGQDTDWREVVNDRHVQYSNLRPGPYHFRVIACNNSGVWNEQGDALEFFVAPAYYQTNWFRALCVLAILAMLWTVYHLRISVLEERQAMLELHHREIGALNEQLMKAQEEERIRIAGELHDGVLQQLTSLALQLGTATLALPPDSEPKAEVREVEKKLIHVGAEIRQLSHKLHPAVLHEKGLPTALSAYCQEFSEIRGIPILYKADENVYELSPGAALCIYRIAQEALGNVAKHANARQVEVRLTRSNGTVCLLVSDDGVGFDSGRNEASGGLGLINMRERVRQLNGTFEFESTPGRGTKVKAEVPFRAAS